MSLITIEQLLESVDLDFEPRFITKDKNGMVWIWDRGPHRVEKWWNDDLAQKRTVGCIKILEFYGKDWTECIYEVPRKAVISKMETTGEIEKIAVEPQERFEPVLKRVIETLNTVVDIVNEINENYACIAALTDIRKRLDTLEKCVKNKRSEE